MTSPYHLSISVCHQIKKEWISLKPMRKGLLKNVQDGIFRPLGGREIHPLYRDILG